jgi:hypothetical protein
MSGARRRGLLLTITEPPPAMAEEFNAWYDTEHLAERLAIPGFRSARRWVCDCAPGEGKYLATYELDSLAVLQSPEYLARYRAPTPWTQRCLGKTVVFRRWACEQLEPGEADPHPGARAVALLLSDAPLPNTARGLQRRRFVATEGEPRHIVLIELASPRGPANARLYRAYAA